MRLGVPKKAKESLSAVEGVHVWASVRFGPNLPRLLKKVACVVVRVHTIEQAVELIQANLDAVAEEYARGEERKHMVLRPE